MKKGIIISSLLLITGIVFADEKPLNTDEIIDKVEVYPLSIYNKSETLKVREDLSSEEKSKIENKIFKSFDFSDKAAFKEKKYIKDNKEYTEIVNELKDDYQNYFYELVEILARSNFLETKYSNELNRKEKIIAEEYPRVYYGEFYDTEVSFNDFHRFESVERFIKRSIGVPTELNVELVRKNMGGTDKNLYHLILSSKKMNNRNVAVIPFLVDVKNKTITRINEDFVFVTPQKVYNGLSEFFNTFLITKNKEEYRNETGRYTEDRDKKDFAKVFNRRTHKISDTRENKKYDSYIEELLDEKLDFFKERRLRNEKNEGKEFNQYGEKFVSEEEYIDLLEKTQRLLHNYQYSETIALNLPDKVEKYDFLWHKNFLYDKQNNVHKIPSDKIFTYSLDDFNKDEIINLNDKDLFKSIPLDDYKIYKTDKNGYLIDELKDEYQNYFKNLLSKLVEEKFENTDISIKSIENLIQRQTGEDSNRYIELVGVEGSKYHYHITIDTNIKENRNVLVVPFTVDIDTKVMTRNNQNILFVTPWNVYNGLSEFLNTYLREYVSDDKIEKVLVEDNYREYKEEKNRYEQEYYRDYLKEKLDGYDSKLVEKNNKFYLNNKKEIVKQFREYTDKLEKDLRQISNIGIDARRESSRRSQNF